MKHKAIFRFLSMLTILFYTSALAQAGQVISQGERSWAKAAIDQEKSMGAISTPNSVAVLYFNNRSGMDTLNPLQKGMAVMLITDLAKVEQLQVVERVRMQALLDEMDLGASGLMDSRTVPAVGKLLGAYFVASGDILKGSGKDLKIASSVLDVPFETLTQQPEAIGPLEQLFKLEKEILFSIVSQLQISLSPAKRAELQKPMSASTTALLALFLGIDHSDKGQYAQAAKMYQQALAEDPNLQMAKSALQELKGMGLIEVEEVGSVDMPLESLPEEEAGGSSIGTIALVGLGVVAVGGVALALAGSSSSSDDDSSDTNDTDSTTATVTPSPSAGETVDCLAGAITFAFTKEMDTSNAEISVSPTDFGHGSWPSAQEYVLSWEHSSTSAHCASTSTTKIDQKLIVSFDSIYDTDGKALSGTRSFTFGIE